MPARILDGKALAQKIRDGLSTDVAALKKEQGVTPGLAAVLVGANPASEVYVRTKRNACKAAGMNGTVTDLPETVEQERLIDVIRGLNADPAVHGILVQLPLPKQIDEEPVLAAVDPWKDVDGFHPENVGLLTIGRPRFAPCTALAVQTMLVASGVETKGARVVVLGRSMIVGKPTALLLMQKGAGGDATVTVAHTASRDVSDICAEAEILIVTRRRGGTAGACARFMDSPGGSRDRCRYPQAVRRLTLRRRCIP